ncbi:restriction endonuclease subunit S [Prosthecobacter sp.]|uniref:restriction endonuclease subunit S n=1 Tax=Prosthecobacter sp. TaxID=1965333 RepID=UPI0037C68A7C
MKPGYKQSEVGVIPEEWECAKLSEFFSFISYGFTNPMPSVHDGVFMITAADINNGRLQLDTARKTSETAYRTLLTAKSKPLKNDILLTKDGTLGRLALVGNETVCINQSVAVIRPNGRVEPQFLKLLLESPRYQKRMVEDAGGSTIKHIYITIVDKMPLGLPLDISEQRAIVAALSDVDGLLGGLDRLIVKKRDLKHAAMQQLLTGQTRLPGFHGEWEVKRLGDAFTITAGKSKSAYIVEGGDFWICDMGSVSIEGRLIVSKRTNYRGDFLKRGDLIMPKDDIGGGNIIGKVGYVDANESYILGDHVYCLRALEGDPRFLAYVINSHRVNSELRKKVIGSAQLGLGRKSVNEQEMVFPSVSEQTAIAEVLTEMDAELAALEQRREKTRAVKQAMMQELLTGRTRLI